MGIVIGIGQTKPQMPYDQFYGIEWDVTVSNPKATRIGKMELHASLPVQSLMRRCVLRDNGEVAYYLDANDSIKKEGGAPAKLDGTDGQVMVEVPAFYVKFEAEGNKRRCLMSLHALPGFTKWEKLYVSAFEASIHRPTNKLSSVVSKSAEYRGGDNDASRDGTFESRLGMPASHMTLSRAREFARLRGSSRWSCYTYQAHKELFWLFAVEYCGFDSQADYSAALDEAGCRQGGLGSSASAIPYFNLLGFRAIIPCGETISLGNSSGVVVYRYKGSEGGQSLLSTAVPSYRGVEYPFGHLQKIVDGVIFTVDGVKLTCRTTTNPNDFGGNESLYSSSVVATAVSGYIKEVVCGTDGDIFAKVTGGSSTTHFCDKFNVSNSGALVAMVGGYGSMGAEGGLASMYVSGEHVSSNQFTGTRLCYHP